MSTATEKEDNDTLSNLPPFYDNLHKTYITSLASKIDKPTSYEGAVMEHLRMSGVYWSITALSLIRSPQEVDELMGLTTTPTTSQDDKRPSIVDWVFACYDKDSGGFGGNIGHDGHLLYTLSALQILAIANKLDDERLNVEKVSQFIAQLQQPDGSFAGDGWGEIDTRFSYCALSALAILQKLPSPEETDGIVDVKKAAEYVASCKNFDGGFGCVPGAESHAGQIFCCVGALSIAQSLHLLDADLLSWWLAERQCDSGGLNGRPEKQADVCYSWWILSALSILGKVPWISTDKLGGFILQCQDEEDGGIADRPGNMPDVFHTFFGIAGLSLIGYLNRVRIDGEEDEEERRVYRKIDPVYALPTDVVERLGLSGQIMSRDVGKSKEEDEINERLKMYCVLKDKDEKKGLS
uniref:Geranylgeranyl transferase type-2 subunit beta n=1 Tax=Ditylum brightwellii TaxID=49249 RepID=A0A6U3TTQ5_9STRA|mmetsp:Transcript_27607/g.41056  ORF Transcript_27607/g.41056 Transcript_27607/m.41056 type:complete len:409 (+) Transcript_27607:179-1405(+)